VTVQNFVFISKSLVRGNKPSEGKLILQFRCWVRSVLEVSECLSYQIGDRFSGLSCFLSTLPHNFPNLPDFISLLELYLPGFTFLR